MCAPMNKCFAALAAAVMVFGVADQCSAERSSGRLGHLPGGERSFPYAISADGVDATQQGSASARTAEPTVKTTGPKPGDGAPAGEAAWGEAAGGLQCRLRMLTPTVQPHRPALGKEHVFVVYELRNVSDKPIRLLPSSTPLWRMSASDFRVVRPDGKTAQYVGIHRTPAPFGPEKFLAIGPGKTLSERVGLPYDFRTPGVYRVSTSKRAERGELKWFYGEHGDKLRDNPDRVWTGTLASNTVTVSVEAPGAKRDGQTPAGEAPWGKAVEGVQVRLRAKQRKWKQGTAVRLWADVRNQGKRNLLVRTRDYGRELEVDGLWYCQPKHAGTIPPPRSLPPGRRYDNIAIGLNRWWLSVAPRKVRAPWKAGPEQLGELTPGKHTVRVAFAVTAAKGPAGKPLKAVSNPVEIEIVAKSDEKVDTTQQGNASVRTAEPTVKTTGAKPDDRAPVGEAPWGEAVEGVQVRLRAKQRKWKQGTVVRLWADVRNQGKRNLFVQTRDYGCELEVDGRWYRQPQPVDLRLILAPSPLPPGRRYDNIPIGLGRSWLFAAPRNARAPWKAGPEQLKLTPGKHTIRVAFAVTAAKNAPGRSFRAVSNPVEIEIVTKSDEKPDTTQQGNASVRTAEPTVKTTGVKPDGQAPAGEAPWGKAVDGVQVRLRARQSKWKQGAVPRLWADVRNQGKRNLFVRTRDYGFQLEVDGRWYRQPVHRGTIGPPRPLPPGRPYDHIAVVLDRSWQPAVSRDARAPWKAGPKQLGELTPGKHTIRVAFTVTAAKNAPGKSFRAVSNPVEIEIVAKGDEKPYATQQGNASVRTAEPTVKTTGVKPDDQAPAGEATWGKAVEGVQVRLRAKQRKWKQGTVVRLWADVRNQGKRNLLVRTRDYGCELEVDGLWYRQPIGLGLIPPPSPLPPGRRYDNISIGLHRSWLFAAPRNARAPWKAGPGQLGELTPGKHTIRVAFAVTPAKNAPGKSFRAVSNPVEIEIVAKNHEKVDATQQGNARAPAAKPTVKATGAKPDDPTTAARPVEPSPKSGRPDGDVDLEKEAIFDMEKVASASEPKLRAVMGSAFTAAVARKGEIKIRGRQYTALLAQLGTTAERFDRPDTLLLLTRADNPKHRIQSYEMHLGAIRTVGGKYYKISATPTGDKLTVTPCGDNVGILRIGAGDRNVEKREVTGGVLLAKQAVVPLGNFYYPVPAEDPAQRRIPVGDYAPDILNVGFGNVGLSLRPNGPPAFNLKIRKDKPLTLNFSAKGNLRLRSPRPMQTFKPGSRVPLEAVIVDPELNLQVCAWDATQKVNKRTYTYAQGKKFTTTSCSISLDPTFVIRDSSGKQVATGKLPFC